MAHDGGNMLGYYALIHLLIGAFGSGVVVLRLPSVVATALTAGIVAALAGRLAGRWVALASGILTAVSLPLVYWGQDARSYAPMVTFVCASYLAFVILVDPRSSARSRGWAIVAYIALTTAALYMSFVAVLVVPAQLCTLAVRRERWRAVLAADAVVGLCCAPLAVLALRRGSGQLFWVPKPNVGGLAAVVRSLTSAAFQPNFTLTATSNALAGASLAALLLAVVLAIVARRRLDERSRFALVVLVSWMVLPVALAWVESSVAQSIFIPRNLLVSMPPVGILLAWLFVGPLAEVARRSSMLGWAVCAGFVALRALQLAPSYGVSPEDWQAATTYVLSAAEPGDCIAFYPSDGRMAFEYYVGTSSSKARAPRSVLPVVPWGTVRPYVEQYATLSEPEVAALPVTCPRLFFVVSHEGQSNGPPASRRHWARYLSLEASLEHAYPSHRSAHFGYAAPVDVQLLSR
jgi:mannosyltransferase